MKQYLKKYGMSNLLLDDVTVLAKCYKCGNMNVDSYKGEPSSEKRYTHCTKCGYMSPSIRRISFYVWIMEITVIIKCPRCGRPVAESFEDDIQHKPYIFCTSCNIILPLTRRSHRNTNTTININTKKYRKPAHQSSKLIGGPKDNEWVWIYGVSKLI